MIPKAKNILRTYLHRLTNLTGTNRSLLVLRLHAEQLIDLHSLSFLNGEKSFSILNALIAGRDKKLCPVLDSRVEANNQASTKIKRLQRVDRFLFEERGSNDLHIGWPFIRGKFGDGTLVRCPLLFFPVSIEQSERDWIIKPRKDAGITFNKSFLLAYAFYNKIKLDEELLETNFEDFNSDSTVFRTEVYQLLKDKIEINFNPDNFRDELTTFQEFKRDQFEDAHHNESLKLFPEAVLGIFPQAGSQLVPDYMHLLEDESVSDLEDFFQRKNSSQEANARQTRVKEEKVYAPFALDAYQEHAIRSIKNGNSIVVQGPPGTGKSQLIANLMADAIASGKRALLVCQKRAALDVVYARLKTLDLGDFLGLVHDFRNDRKDIFSKIARQIEHIDDYKARNRSVDAIQMERRFFQICRAIDQITEELENFKEALFDDKECGLTVKELYLTSNPHADTINIRQEYQHFHFSGTEDFLRKLKAYSGYAATFETEEYPWRERKSFSSYRLSDLKEIEKTIRHISACQEQINEAFHQLLSIPMNLEDAESFRAREDEVLGMIALLRDDETYRYFQAMIEESDEETSLLWFSNLERVALNCFNSEGVESSLASHELVKFQEALQLRMKARKSLIRLIRWELFSEHKFWVKRVLVANDLAYNKAGLLALEQRLDSRLNLEHHITAIRKKHWLKDMPENYEHEEFKTWFERQKFAIRIKLIFGSLREVKKAINPHKYSVSEFVDLFKKLVKIVQPLPEWRREWLYYLTPYQVRHLIADPSLQSHYLQIVKRDFDNLCEFDKLIESLKPHEKDVIGKLNEGLVRWDYKILESLFQNSLRLAWIDHIEVKYPILRSVSSRKMEELQSELQQRIAEKQKLSTEILLMRARERVYESVAYNRLNNMITYRDLNHQVIKKKKIWPLRKVITEFTDEIFQILPCWLASPESVSAIFPLRDLFDLVIFDEASQCFAERGIPSIYRSRQILIAGDDMQLKPNELYQVRWEEDGDHPDQEIDSLLDLAERYLSTVHLQGHYRSKSFELIDFSNTHFYGSRLQVLPDRHVINKKQPAIEYCKVDGRWENNANEVEAREVVQKILDIDKESPDKQIGVVTFNAPQQMLILDLLEEAYGLAGRSLPSTVFVKNIENVQGDERDIIIFSTGYAPDKKGNLMMQFGSFSMAGGENRLNVAVTRAREKIIIVSSIWPEQLRIEDVKNDGPKLLKKYLEFARTVHQQEFKLQPHRVKNRSASWYLNERLKSWASTKFTGFNFETNTLPFSDLHFLKSGDYEGIVLTDDSRYMESLNIKDGHAYTQTLLQNKNWTYYMVFSRNFWQDREKVENDLSRFIGSQS